MSAVSAGKMAYFDKIRMSGHPIHDFMRDFQRLDVSSINKNSACF